MADVDDPARSENPPIYETDDESGRFRAIGTVYPLQAARVSQAPPGSCSPEKGGSGRTSWDGKHCRSMAVRTASKNAA